MNLFKKLFITLFLTKEKGNETHGEVHCEEEEPTSDEQCNFDYSLDCTGMTCPRPIFEISKRVKTMETDQVLRIICSDPAFDNDIKAWCHRTKNGLQDIQKINGKTVALIVKMS
ncbi:MAG: sulfurtransferase TusA family protein [Spirochaetota bacterium]|nr:sulfurtransferase TusA family protein [Spirochaetota bacterium]